MQEVGWSTTSEVATALSMHGKSWLKEKHLNKTSGKATRARWFEQNDKQSTMGLIRANLLLLSLLRYFMLTQQTT